MRGTAFLFVITAAVSATLGMAWGIHMSASGDHLMAPAHAHLNLIGWASMALFGLYYHAVPSSADSTLARVHYAVATAGVVLIVPGIYMAISDQGDILAKIGSVLTIGSMLIFLFTVWRDRS